MPLVPSLSPPGTCWPAALLIQPECGEGGAGWQKRHSQTCQEQSSVICTNVGWHQADIEEQAAQDLQTPLTTTATQEGRVYKQHLNPRDPPLPRALRAAGGGSGANTKLREFCLFDHFAYRKCWTNQQENKPYTDACAR